MIIDREWDELIKEQQDRKKRLESLIKKFVGGVALIGAAVLLTGFYEGDQVQVETVHKVQKGETLWSISEDYLKKNTGGRRYIMEFMEGVKELNPWIKENGYVVHPGDRVRVNYWIKKEPGASE